MPISELIQRLVHLLDVGAGSVVIRRIMVGLIICTLCLWYDLRDFKNFSAPEAMDSAQLAHNVSEGRGYTTDFVRPLSIYLIRHWNEAKNAGKAAGVDTDFARMQSAHPDLANPPVYPFFLAGLMKVLPFHHAVEYKASYWAEGGDFKRYEPDFLIALINELLMVLVVWQTFWLARKLFDVEVAWVSAALVLGCELIWQFSISGLSTMLVMVIFLGLTQVLMGMEAAAREPEPSRKKLVKLAIAAGLLVAAGTLTRYSFGWLIVPVLVFVAMVGGPERWRQVQFAGGAFLVLLAPWVVRNFLVSGTPFGTAGFAIMEGTYFFPKFQLERSLHPDMTVAYQLLPYFMKFWANLGDILENEVPRLGRSWVTMLFFAGLIMKFRGLAVRRVRYFLLMCLATLIVVQSLGRTQLSEESPLINTENLLVLVLPLVLIYGAVFFFTFMDQIEFPLLVPVQQLRYAAMVAFIVVMSFPMLGTLFARSADPVSYPPYYPPDIQQAGKWMKPKELIMCDVPWAVAWYGHRQCIWLTLNPQDDYYAVNDFIKPIQALYLTPETLDLKVFSEGLSTPKNSWGNFILAKATTDVPWFPLKQSPSRTLIRTGLFLTDRARWLQTSDR